MIFDRVPRDLSRIAGRRPIASPRVLGHSPCVSWGELIKEQESSLGQAAEGLAERNPEKVLAALGATLLGMATGHPEIAVLSPLATVSLRRLFVSPANRILEQQAVALRVDADRAHLVAMIAQTIEALLEESLIQTVRLQSATGDAILRNIAGLEHELVALRTEYQRQLCASPPGDPITLRGDHNQLATNGGIAIGGSVSNSVLSTNIATPSARSSRVR